MKKILFFLLLLGSCMGAYAQRGGETEPIEEEQPPARQGGFDPSRLVLGGDLGLSFSGDYGFLMIAPTLGYRFTDRFTAGAAQLPAYLAAGRRLERLRRAGLRTNALV